MSKTLSDLPMDLHRLILSHDEEKIQLKKENEKLKTQVTWYLRWYLMDKQQMQPSDESDYEEEHEVTEQNIQDMMLWSLPQLRRHLREAGIKGYSKKNKREIAIRLCQPDCD